MVPYKTIIKNHTKTFLLGSNLEDGIIENYQEIQPISYGLMS